MNGTAVETEVQMRVGAIFRRIFASDLGAERATPGESRALLSAGVTHPLAQAYAAWRYPLLYLACALLLFNGIWQLATFGWTSSDLDPNLVSAIGAGNLDTLDTFRLLGVISLLIGTVIVALSAVFWFRLRTSQKVSLVGWCVVFVTPFLLAIFPRAGMMDLKHLNPQAASQLKGVLGLLFGLQVIVSIGPKILALFPGIIRSSMTLKTLLPESSAIGWVTVITAPLYTGFLLAMLAAINQLHGSYKLAFGVLFLLLSPLVYVVCSKRIVRPGTTGEMGSRLVWTRRLSSLVNLVGVVLLMWSVLEIEGVGTGDVIAFVIGVMGNVLLLMVVCSDFVLPLLRWSFRQGKDFQGTELMRALDAKYGALELVSAPAAAGVVQAREVVSPKLVVEAAPAPDEAQESSDDQPGEGAGRD